MIRSIVLSILLIFSLCACKKDELKHCGGKDPINNLAWLKELTTTLTPNSTLGPVDSGCYTIIWQGIYKGDIVFITGVASDSDKYFCDGVAIMYSCSGEIIKYGYDPEVKNQKVIWPGK